MKTMKKVISVILAVMMIVGTLTVAASAYVAPGSNQKIYWTLLTEVMNSTGGAQELTDSGVEAKFNSKASKTAQNADLAAYNGLSSHTYTKSEDGYVYAKSGQIIWVTINLKTEGEVYPLLADAHIYYQANGVLLSSNVNTTMCVQGNVFANYPNTCTVTPWAALQDTKRTDSKINKSGGSLKVADWHMMYALNMGDPTLAENSGKFAKDVDANVVTFPLFVSKNVTFGKSIIALDGRGILPFVQGYPEGDTYLPDAETMVINDAAHSDYSNSVLTVLVGDFAAINTQMKAFEALDEEDWTAETYGAAETAYNAAAKAKADMISQDAIDTAASNLETAIKNLEEPSVGPTLDYTAINAAIDSVPESLEAYTTSTAAAVTSALSAAQTAKAEATTQEELTNAANALNTAVSGLKLKADMTAINTAITEAGKVARDNYTTASLDVLDAKVAAAQEILKVADDFYDTDAVATAAQDIYDAIDALVELGADYTCVENAKALSKDFKSTDYTVASWEALQQAIAAVQPGLPKSQQETVNDYAQEIIDKTNALVPLADLSALAAAVENAGKASSADYSVEVWNQITGYVTTATTTYLGKEVLKTAQNDVDTLTQNLNTALANKLGDADYSLVEAALAKVPKDQERDPYTAASLKALDDAVAAVEYNLKADKQQDVNNMAAAIEDAITNLEIRKADLTNLNAALLNAGKISEDDEELYTAETWKTFTDALAAANAYAQATPAPLYTEQENIEKAAEDLNNAVTGLKYVGADWQAIDALVSDANNLNRDNYTAASLTAFDSAFAATLEMYNNKASYDITDQELINAQAVSGAAAFDKLVLKGANYAEVDEAIARSEGADYVESYYPAELWAELQKALDAVDRTKTILEQKDVDDMAKAINDALDVLDENMLDADYSEVDRYLGIIEGKTSTDYTAASWAKVTEAVAGVERGKKANQQAEVWDMEDALDAAIRGLKSAGPADYTNVYAAIDRYNKLDKSLYTAESKAVVEGEIDKVDYQLNENFQDTVEGFATAINNAIDELKEIQYNPADYSEVDKAIKRYDDIPDKSIYTQASVKKVEDAIAAVNRDLDERSQGIVDGYAAAINDAIDKLAVPVGTVVDVTYTQGPDRAKTYTIKVNGRAEKVQFIAAENVESGTSTFTMARTDARATVVSYDKDGEVVSSLSKDLAYEIWTFDGTLNPKDYVVRAKYADGWEATDLGYTVTLTLSASDKTVTAITPATESAKVGEALNLDVVTGKDVVKVQVIVDDADTGAVTFDRASVTSSDEKTQTFGIYVKLYKAGAHTLKIRIKTADGWEIYDGVTANVTAVK